MERNDSEFFHTIHAPQRWREHGNAALKGISAPCREEKRYTERSLPSMQTAY